MEATVRTTFTRFYIGYYATVVAATSKALANLYTIVALNFNSSVCFW